MEELYKHYAGEAKRDVAGPTSKFLVPTVANCRIHVGTQTELAVYGEP